MAKSVCFLASDAWFLCPLGLSGEEVAALGVLRDESLLMWEWHRMSRVFRKKGKCNHDNGLGNVVLYCPDMRHLDIDDRTLFCNSSESETLKQSLINSLISVLLILDIT
ncbi:hypothetical protein Tco_0243472 [Tanacetum coccineum]